MTRGDDAPPAPSKVPLLERPDLKPEDRKRIGRAVSGLLAAGLVGIAALGVLAIWHLVRRGRLIRERLAPPKPVRLPEVEPAPNEPPPTAQP
jgi:hypothetical protein